MGSRYSQKLMGRMKRKLASSDKELSGSIPVNRRLEAGITHGALFAGAAPKVCCVTGTGGPVTLDMLRIWSSKGSRWEGS